MTDQRFKELLNLYLDHRLDGDAALEFEHALRADARRRKMLRDYALIQGGCTELFQRAAAQAPSSAALCRSLRAVESRMARTSNSEAGEWGWRGWTAGIGFAGAGLAACATLFVVMRTDGPTETNAQAIANLPEPARVTVVPLSESTVNMDAKSVVTEAPVLAVESLSEQQQARNLTLVALGLSVDDSTIARPGKHWADAQEAYELANLSPSARQWILATSTQDGTWAQSASLGTKSGFSARLAQPASYRIEPTGFRFER